LKLASALFLINSANSVLFSGFTSITVYTAKVFSFCSIFLSFANWTSTSVRKTNTSLQAVSLHFSHSEVGLEVDDRQWAYPIFKIQ